ncbi:MAG: hypothetical protein DHS20C02_00200 [Micavibrio sp.]|nr:MAG: hypothetical protein DHS20C02_00200 [Micavibrio sp.]
MFSINGPVGNNLTNHENDVITVKDAFERLGRFEEKERNGFITRELDTAIKDFQNKNDLKIDGLLLPEGETEKTVRDSLRSASEEGGNGEDGNMPAVPPGDVESEPLAPPSIPGTNIPDHGVPEQGNPKEDFLDDRDKWRYEVDPNMQTDRPKPDFNIPIPNKRL